jgi:H/ACA ribonucleoprotein complex subunit 4
MGTVNLDKQRGPTSHEIAHTVKKILGLQQLGHGGTLEKLGEIPPSPAYCL